MKTRIHLVPVLALIAAISTACSAAPEPPLETYRGTMRSSCAPHDAPSTALELRSTSSEAAVSFNLWPPSGMVPPATVRFDDEHPAGQGTFCSTPGQCVPVAWGTVTLKSTSGGGGVTAEGDWSIGMADRAIYRGTFTADWLTIQAWCG